MTIEQINEILQAVMWIILPVMTFAMLLTFIRIVRGPSLPDRVVAIDKLSAVAVAVMVAYSVAVDDPVFLDIALVVGILGFLGTIGFAYYVDRRS